MLAQRLHTRHRASVVQSARPWRPQRSLLRCHSILQQDPPSTRQPHHQERQPAQQQLQPDAVVSSLERLLNPGLEISPPPSGTPFTAPGADCIWHFAFGANMNFRTLSKRGVKILARDPAVIADPTVKLAFRHRGGYATLHRTDGPWLFPTFRSHVHGVLYKLSSAEMDKLRKREGGYAMQDMEVITYDGRRVMAKVFVSGPLATLSGEVKPTERYMRLLREGAADNYLDPLYQAWLSSVETVPSAGLPHEYFETPAKHIAYAFLAVVALLISGFFAQHV